MKKVARPSRGAPSRERGFWSRVRANRAAAGGGGVLLVMLVLAVGPGWVTSHGPDELGVFEDVGSLREPFFHACGSMEDPPGTDGSMEDPPGTDGSTEDPDARDYCFGSMEFPLGSDATGHCVLCFLIHGARYSLGFSLVAVGLSLFLSIALGLVAVFAGGVIDVVLMRLMDLLLSVPSLLLAIVVATMLDVDDRVVWGLAIDGGALCAAVALAFVYLPHFVRLLRATARAEMGREYVAAARLDGVGALRLMTVTVLPNCMAPIIVQATLSVSNAVLDFAALGYLGLGVVAGVPEWGSMLAQIVENEGVVQRWWMPAAPAMAIVATVVSLSLLGDGLREVLDPKLRSR